MEEHRVKKYGPSLEINSNIQVHPYPFNFDHKYIVNLATPEKKKKVPENLGCHSWWQSGLIVVMVAQRFFARALPEITIRVVFFLPPIYRIID